MAKNWNLQIVKIQCKGRQARRDGFSERANPYAGGYNGGGSLQKQRRDAWLEGFRSEPEPTEILNVVFLYTYLPGSTGHMDNCTIRQARSMLESDPLIAYCAILGVCDGVPCVKQVLKEAKEHEAAYSRIATEQAQYIFGH